MVWTPLWANNFNGGTNGTTVTATNSGTGTNSQSPSGTNNAITRLNAGDVGALSQFTSAITLAGGLAHEQYMNTTTKSWAFVDLVTAYDDLSFGAVFRYDGSGTAGAPLSSGPIMRWYSGQYTGTGMDPMQLTTSKKFYLRDGGSATNTPSSALEIPNGAGIYLTSRYQASLKTLKTTAYLQGSTTAITEVTCSVPTDLTLRSINYGMGHATSPDLHIYWDSMVFGTGGEPPRLDVVASTIAAFAGMTTVANWIVAPSGASIPTVLGDTDDTTNLTSSDNPTSQSLAGWIQPLVDPNGNWVFHIDAERIGGASGKLVGQVLEGATSRYTSGDIAVSARGDYTFTVPSATVAAFADAAWTTPNTIKLVLYATVTP